MTAQPTASWAFGTAFESRESPGCASKLHAALAARATATASAAERAAATAPTLSADDVRKAPRPACDSACARRCLSLNSRRQGRGRVWRRWRARRDARALGWCAPRCAACGCEGVWRRWRARRDARALGWCAPRCAACGCEGLSVEAVLCLCEDAVCGLAAIRCLKIVSHRIQQQL